MSETTGATPPRFVFDTNVLVSALLFSESVPGRAFFAAFEGGVLLLSADTAGELADVLARPKFDRYISVEERARFLSALLNHAKLVEVEQEVAVCRDPRDDEFLSLALTGAAAVMVTGDEDLLALHPFRGIRIISAGTLLAELTAA